MVPGNASSARVTLPTGLDPNRSLLLFGVAVQDNSPNCALFTGTLDATAIVELAFTRFGSSCAPAEVTWQVAEFSSGIRVVRGGQAFGNPRVGSVPLPGLVDPSTTFVMAHFRANGAQTNDNDVLDVALTSSTLDLELNAVEDVGFVSWQVVQMGEGSVEHRAFSIPNNSGSTSLVPAEPGGILVLHYLNTSPMLDTDDATLGADHDANGNVRIRRRGTGGAIIGHVQVIHFPARMTVLPLDLNITGVQATGAALPSTVVPARTLLFANGWHHAAGRGTSGAENIFTGEVMATRAISVVSGTNRVTVKRANANGESAVQMQLLGFP